MATPKHKYRIGKRLFCDLRFALLDLARLRRDDLPERNRAAAFARILGNPSSARLRELTDAVGWMDEDKRELHEALPDWVYAMAAPTRFPGALLGALAGTEDEMSMSMLEENVKEWTQEWRREGLEEGLAHGRAEGRARARAEMVLRERRLLHRQASRRFGAATAERLTAVLVRVFEPEHLEEIGDLIVDCDSSEYLLDCVKLTMLEEQVKQWTEMWRRDGREEGLARGKVEGRVRGNAEGLAHEHCLLWRQASRRFGAAVGEPLAAALLEVSDPARLDQVGDLIVDCATGEELLGRLYGAGWPEHR